MKRCSRCNILKSSACFRKHKGYKDGLHCWCVDCMAQYRQQHIERIRAQNNASKLKKKIKVMEYYGGRCACCGENILAFLTIDHIANDGGEHRKKISSGSGIYNWLATNNFPPGFQVLCFNCNCGRSVNGGICPHKDRRIK